MTRIAAFLAVLLAIAQPARADLDGDGVEDAVDNCPYTANPGQEDAGGLLTPNGDAIGDVCQCGDVSDDGIPDVLDVSLYRRALLLLGPGLVAPQKCDVAPDAGSCDLDDVARFRSALAGEPPGLDPLCAPAQPPGAICGDGVREGAEACDGGDLGGVSCQALGYVGGTLACTPDCTFDASACTPAGEAGDVCAVAEQCGAGLDCADGVCCTSACTGTCQACDLLPSPGQCTAVPGGQDIDDECGGVGCSGFFHSWSGDSCRRKADVPPAVAACNGAGACRTQAQECSLQSAVGPVTTTCHPTCQDPNLSTCTGTIPGACTNVNPGTQTCGTGICVRSGPICNSGVPATCTPGPPNTETCNDLDDNCNGTVDDGAFADAFEPNPDCGTLRTLNGVGSDQTNSYNTMTVFSSGDVDQYRIVATETDNSCGCGGISTDEDYQIRATLTVPSDAGSYEFCMNTNTCGYPAGYCFTVAAGTSLTVSQYLDGACGPGQTDVYQVYLRVSGATAPGFECRPYSLSYTFDAGLCR